MAFGTVLLDLDGTITNPYMGITNGVMYAYEHLGLEVPPRESLRSFIGPPLIVEFTRRGMRRLRRRRRCGSIASTTARRGYLKTS